MCVWIYVFYASCVRAPTHLGHHGKHCSIWHQSGGNAGVDSEVSRKGMAVKPRGSLAAGASQAESYRSVGRSARPSVRVYIYTYICI